MFPPRSRRTEELWYAQRVEDPLRVSVVSVGKSTYCLEKRVSATVLFYPLFTGAPTDCHRGSTRSLLFERGQIWLAKCAPFRLVPRPVNWTFGLPSKHLPAAPAARQAGSALVILTVLSVGAPSSCSSHKLRQFQLAPHSGPPCGARVSSAVRPRGSFAFARSMRYYESSAPDSLAAAIWFTGTTKKSHAYVTFTYI